MIQKEIEKFTDSTILEGMTSISAVINGIREKINQRPIHTILYDAGRAAAKKKELGFLRAVANEIGFVLKESDAETIDQMTIGSTHGGMIALCGERPIPSFSDKTLPDIWGKKDGFFVLMEGMEDPYNFGYALRSLYASGVDGVILTPHNWMGAAGVVARASAGASELLPMVISSPEDAISRFQSYGYHIVCAGIRDSVSLYEAKLTRPLVLVIGGEKRGISRAVLNRADEIVRIDYGRPFRGSLSATSAATVLAFEVLRQNSQ